MNWQPIETAPKDQVIDLWHPEFGRLTDQWWDAEDGFDWPVEGATHWMHVPESPAERSAVDERLEIGRRSREMADALLQSEPGPDTCYELTDEAKR